MKDSLPGRICLSVWSLGNMETEAVYLCSEAVCTLEYQHNCKISHVQGLGQDWSVAAGAGMIFSQGLMRMRSYEDIELAVRSMGWAHQGAGGQPFQP